MPALLCCSTYKQPPRSRTTPNSITINSNQTLPIPYCKKSSVEDKKMVVAEPEMIPQREVSGIPSTGHHHLMIQQNYGDSKTQTTTNDNHNNSNNNNVEDLQGSYLFSNPWRQSSIYALTLEEFQHTLHENRKDFGSMNMDEFVNSIWSAEESQQAYHSQHHHHDQINSTDLAQLSRQGSLSVPAPLCRKTVDEVWSEIQNTQQQQKQKQKHQKVRNYSCTQCHPTFGEMTLEDFLIKAGVRHPLYGLANSHPNMGLSFLTRPMMSAHQAMPVGPVSPDGVWGPGQKDDVGGQYGMEFEVLRGRKRIIDGPVEKVVERRRRRMIKNRESAARSRARKQAYTIELEAELNLLREENAQLQVALTDIEGQRRQQDIEEQKLASLTKAQRAQEKLKTLKRSRSCIP